MASAGSRGRGATRGGVRASTTGLAFEHLSVVEPVLAGLGQHPQRHRRTGHPVAAGVGEHADEDLVGVQGTEHPVAAVEQTDELAAGELGQRRHRLEVGVDPVEELLGQRRHRGSEPADLPGAAEPARGGHRVQLLHQ